MEPMIGNPHIFWPMLLQVMLPVIVLLVMAGRKGADRKNGNVDLRKAALDNKAWGEGVLKTSNNLANQFQVPVLFHVLCLIAFSLNAVTPVFLGIACFFVASRYAHALVHMTSNHVPSRFRLFVLGVLAIGIMIGMLAVRLFTL